MKRPEGVCKDCWGEYLGAQDDCPSATMPRWRPAPKPGPRCVTHDRAWKKNGRLKAHARRIEANFGIPSELYWALYEFQGGKCAILRCRATGKTKALAVDHDHRCCPGRTSCGKCVRGLLCGPHNEMFGRNGDDPAVFRNMADYLEVSTMDNYRTRLSFSSSAQDRELLFALQSSPQGEQLDGDPGTRSIQQDTWPVSRDWPHPGPIDPIAG